MSVNTKIGTLKRGDWVKATNDNGASITGQVQHDLGGWGAEATLVIQVEVNNGVRINVNFWTVERLMANLLEDTRPTAGA